MGNHEVYQAVMDESKKSNSGITAAKVHQIAMDLLKDESLVAEFMLSDLGGFTPGEINRVSYQKNYQKKYYQKNALNMG